MNGYKKTKLVVSMLFICLSYSVFLWLNKYNIESFAFQRVGYLAYNIDNDASIVTNYHSNLPYSASLLTSLHYVLDIKISNLIFIPIVPVVGVFSSILASRLINTDYSSIIFGFSIGLYVFWQTPHFREYRLSMALYLIFVFLLFMYLRYKEKRYLFLVLIIYLSIRYFGLPMEIWVLTLLGLLWIVGKIAKDMNINAVINYSPASIYLLSVVGVFALWYNEKLYGSFIGRRIVDLENPVDQLIGFFYELINTQTQNPYISSPSSPTHLRILVIFWMAIFSFIILFYYMNLARMHDVKFYTWDFKKLFFSIILVAGAIEIIVYMLVGFGVSLRYATLVFPLVAGHIINNIFSINTFRMFAIVMVVLSVGVVGLNIMHEEYRPYTGDDINQKSVEFIQYTPDQTVTTDHHTFTEMRMIAGSSGINPDSITQNRYDVEKLQYLAGESIEKPELNALLINNKTSDRPMFRGPPGWEFYLSYDSMDSTIHNKENKIYHSEYVKIYDLY